MARRPSPRPRLVRRSGAAIVALATLGSFAASSPATAAAGDRLRIEFNQGDSLASGTRVTDVSGYGNHGVVRSNNGGRITASDGHATFPSPCTAEPCPNAMIEVDDAGSLDPGTAPFEWGARVRMHSSEAADGENVVQKGRWGDNGGQWKLQIDKAPARPSCVVSGFRNGTEHRVIVRSSVGVADGTWHTVVCRRTASGVQVIVDGVQRGSASMPAVDLDSPASVTIGAKDVKSRDNDQFHGKLDEVFMRMI